MADAPDPRTAALRRQLHHRAMMAEADSRLEAERAAGRDPGRPRILAAIALDWMADGRVDALTDCVHAEAEAEADGADVVLLLLSESLSAEGDAPRLAALWRPVIEARSAVFRARAARPIETLRRAWRETKAAWRAMPAADRGEDFAAEWWRRESGELERARLLWAVDRFERALPREGGAARSERLWIEAVLAEIRGTPPREWPFP